MKNNKGFVFVMTMVTMMIVLSLTTILFQESFTSYKVSQSLINGQEAKNKHFSMIQDCLNRLMTGLVIDDTPDSIVWGLDSHYTSPDFEGVTCNIQHKVENYSVVKIDGKPLYEISSGGLSVDVKLLYSETGSITGFMVL